MTQDQILSRQLDAIFKFGAIRQLTDGQLLEQFARGEGEAVERAFAVLVERHGAMVTRVCRSRLADPNDRQDAFQATFLVLVEKAGGLWTRDSLGPWLHQVALRTASRVRAAANRRRRLERRAAEMIAGREPGGDADDPETARLLRREIERLPERYRVPIVLCDLEGRSCEEAAREMGRPVGTIKSWRSRGRERLRDRLIRAGLAPSVAAAIAIPASASAADRTIEAAIRILSDESGAGAVPASVSILAQEVTRTMFFNQLRTVAAGVCALTLIGSGLLSVAAEDPNRSAAKPPRVAVSQPPAVAPPSPDSDTETWRITLQEAIRIGLRNNDSIVRVLLDTTEGGGASSFVIARSNPDIAPSKFKAAVMAHARSIEQQYWALSQQQIQLRSREVCVKLGEDVLRKERLRLDQGHSTTSSVGEAQQQLERFQLAYVAATSDVITTERQLRTILGLPPADNRRIVPITPPVEDFVMPDWESSLAIMLEKRPDIVQARAYVNEFERKDRPVWPLPPGGKVALAELIERHKTHLREIVHQTTRQLAGYFREIDTNHKQFKAATRMRVAARERLDAARSQYDAGRLAVDRFLDAVVQHTEASNSEAIQRASYNMSRAAIEEAKGTLLETAGITVARDPEEKDVSPTEFPRAPHSRPAQIEPGRFAAPGTFSPAPPRATVEPSMPAPTRVGNEAAKPDPTGKTYSFHLSIASGPRPIEIRGSFTVAPAGAETRPR